MDDIPYAPAILAQLSDNNENGVPVLTLSTKLPASVRYDLDRLQELVAGMNDKIKEILHGE